MELDIIEKGILGAIILVGLAIVFSLTELVIALAVLIIACFILGFVGEKIIDHILDEEQ